MARRAEVAGSFDDRLVAASSEIPSRIFVEIRRKLRKLRVS